MSPQLNNWIYGYFPHSFDQQIRFGGFRAVVFLGHGLLVATFFALVCGAAAALWRLRIRTFGLPPILVVFYLLVVLVLSKTVGALLIGLCLLISVRMLAIKTMRKIVGVIIILVISYPLLTLLELIPYDDILNLVLNINPERTESLAFRFHNEILMANHIKPNFFFGLGGWGRSMPAGAITDGYWIIVFGFYGFVGFAALFGLPILAAIRALKSTKYLHNKDEIFLTISHALVIMFAMLDQIPNDSMSAWIWLYAGALLGRSTQVKLDNELKKRSHS